MDIKKEDLFNVYQVIDAFNTKALLNGISSGGIDPMPIIDEVLVDNSHDIMNVGILWHNPSTCGLSDVRYHCDTSEKLETLMISNGKVFDSKGAGIFDFYLNEVNDSDIMSNVNAYNDRWKNVDIDDLGVKFAEYKVIEKCNFDDFISKRDEINKKADDAATFSKISKKCYKIMNGKNGSFYSAGISVPKSVSENGFVNISCDDKHIDFKDSYINITFDNPDSERTVSVVKNGQHVSEKMKISHLVIYHKQSIDEFKESKKQEAVKSVTSKADNLFDKLDAQMELK